MTALRAPRACVWDARERAQGNTQPPLAFPLSTVAVDICSPVLCECALEMDEEARHCAYYVPTAINAVLRSCVVH